MEVSANNGFDRLESGLTTQTTQTLKRFNSTLFQSILNLNNSTLGITEDNSTELPIDKPKFSSMEIWFIATGSVILAVIVLFCINTCIQCQLLEKIAKKYKREKSNGRNGKTLPQRPGSYVWRTS